MRIRTFFKKIAACTLSAAVLLSPASALGADIQTDMTSAESQDTESAASETEDLYGVEAYANLEAIYQNFPQRINDENNRSENVTNAGYLASGKCRQSSLNRHRHHILLCQRIQTAKYKVCLHHKNDGQAQEELTLQSHCHRHRQLACCHSEHRL